MTKKGSTQVRKLQKSFNTEELVEGFLAAKKILGLTDNTLRCHRNALRKFFGEYQGDIADLKATRKAVLELLVDRRNEYYNKLLQALRQFFEYCMEEGVLAENPCAKLKYKSHTTRIVQHDEHTIKTLVGTPDKGTFSGLRDYTLMLVMLDTGARPSELLQLKITDIDFANKQIIIREEYSKTRQIRLLPLSPQVIQALRKLIGVRHKAWHDVVPVFCSCSGKRLPSPGLQERFRAYSRSGGVTVTPYHLRHTFALWFIRNNGNIFALQRIMGHAKLEMTKNYVDLVQADIKGAHEVASPINTLFAENKVVRRLK